jgi:hypothetical protein
MIARITAACRIGIKLVGGRCIGANEDILAGFKGRQLTLDA